MADVILYGQKGGGKHAIVPQYTGQCRIVSLAEDGSSGYMELLTSGTLTWKKNVIPSNVDVFCAGGGAGGMYGKTVGGAEYAGAGGGSGYTKTAKNVTLAASTEVVIGAGGAIAAGGGATSFGSLCTANGGEPGSMDGTAYGQYTGGKGGSGGGDGGRGYNNNVYTIICGSKGGSDGSNGVKTASGGSGVVGTGQGTTTKDLIGRKHAGGGAGGSGWYSSGAAASSEGGASDFENGKGENGANYSTTESGSGSASSKGGGGGGGFGGGGGGGASNSAKAPGIGGQGFAMIAWGNYRSILNLA